MCSSQADWHIADFCDKFIWGQIKCCIYTASTQLFNSSFQVKEIDARRRKKNPTCQIAKMCVQSWHVQFPMEWEQSENLPRTWVGSRGKGCLWGKAAWGNRQTQTVAQGGLSFNVWSATYWGFHGSSEVKKKKKKKHLSMQETWVWSLDRKCPLKKEMAIHSSVLAWEIPWTEEHGGLQSLGSQRVRHDLMTKWPW